MLRLVLVCALLGLAACEDGVAPPPLDDLSGQVGDMSSDDALVVVVDLGGSD